MIQFQAKSLTIKVRGSLSILPSHLRIDACRSHPQQASTIHLSHVRGNRAPPPHPPSPPKKPKHMSRMSGGRQTPTCTPHPHRHPHPACRPGSGSSDTTPAPCGSPESSSGSRPRATPTGHARGPVQTRSVRSLLPPRSPPTPNYQARRGLPVSSRASPSGFDLSVAPGIVSIRRGPQPLRTPRDPAASPPPCCVRLGRPRLRTHPGGSHSQEPLGQPVRCWAPAARPALAPNQSPLGWGLN